MTDTIPKTHLPPNPARKAKGSPPTHKLYRVVRGRGNLDKDTWTEVAACWPHKDGHGFNVKFKFNEAPANGGEYVMRRDARRDARDEVCGGDHDTLTALRARHRAILRVLDAEVQRDDYRFT